MKDKLAYLQQTYYHRITQDIKLAICTIRFATINETLYVMYSTGRKPQLFASVEKYIGARHLSLQIFIKSLTVRLRCSEQLLPKTIIYG